MPMPGLKIHRGDWVVVCDGAKALILENVGDDVFPNLQTREVHEHEDPRSRDIGSDAAGRAVSGVGNSGGAMQETDWHEQAERTFLETLAARLDAAVQSSIPKALIIIAPPRALGILRAAYSSHVRAAVRAEVDKDYVKLPVHEIEHHLAA
jgi:protein required for attachment to host cells